MRAVILAAGKGTRLRPLTDSTPKPLIDVCGKPLVAHVLDALPSVVDEIVFIIGYLGEQIRAHFGEAYRGIPLRYVTQPYLDGTGGALDMVRDDIREATLVLNADDVYAPHDLVRLAQLPLAVLARLTDGTVAHPFEVSATGLLRGFVPKRDIIPGVTYWQNCGAYMVDARYFLEPLVEVPTQGGVEASIPHTLASLARREKVHVIEATAWMPVGTPEELELARNTLCGRVG